MLERMRYLEAKDVFELLVALSKHEDQTVQNKARETLEHIAQYNLFVLKKIDYYPQELILTEIESWEPGQLRLLWR